jgi:hypothetical protein
VPPPTKVKKLAAELVAQGIDSQYLARVTARVSPDEQLESLEAEIAREMAQSLGRSEDRVNLALAELDLHKGRYEHALREGAAFNTQRTAAQARLRELLIHREAIGFRRNNMLADLYPIPPKLRPPGASS